VKSTVVKYKGYTITKAILDGGFGEFHNGWDATKEGTDFHQAARTLREAKIDVLVDIDARARA
jgi:hypothetical protein